MAFALRRFAFAALGCIALATVSALAMAPMLRPDPSPDIPVGQAAPFAGSWSLAMPSREVTEPGTTLAICTLPIRIEAADDTHIFYLGPRETEPDAAIELVAVGDGTGWQPIAGGPAFFALWITPDRFYLYDAVAEGEPDWDSPYIYERCFESQP